MNLTFKGFLRTYCRDLTQLQTDNLRKLCDAVATSAPAAAEALMLFAAAQNKASYLAALSDGTWMEDDYRQQATILESCPSLEGYLTSNDAPTRYKKVWNAFIAKRDGVIADRRIIALMRGKTLSALQRAGFSIYRLCKDLNLNYGNIYAYLNGGDTSKVSKNTARRILEHASR